MTKISITPTTSYKKSKESSKTEKSKNSVLIILGIISAIAVTLLIIIYFRGYYRTQQDINNNPPIDNTRIPSFINPVYKKGANTTEHVGNIPVYDNITTDC